MMNRRHFLKGLTQMTAAGVLLAAPKIAPVVSASFVRGLPQQRNLLIQPEAGEQFYANTTFGPGCKVINVYKLGDLIYAELDFSGNRFHVVSTDGNRWASTTRHLVY
ncbi:MAG: twin-arginine translocation signal domain-containing protein [Chloroflexota bacterium]